MGTFTVPPLVKTVTFRYLAGFGRRNVDDRCKLNPRYPEDYLAHSVHVVLEPGEAGAGVRQKFIERHLRKLAILKAAFGQSRDRPATKVRPLHDMCVGLDYFGDEMHYPYCSFAHVDFVNFLLGERRRRNNHFGFRIHAGELFNFKNAKFMDVHMGVVSANVYFILTKYEEYLKHMDPLLADIPTDVPPPIRIGHGKFFFGRPLKVYLSSLLVITIFIFPRCCCLRCCCLRT